MFTVAYTVWTPENKLTWAAVEFFAYNFSFEFREGMLFFYSVYCFKAPLILCSEIPVSRQCRKKVGK